ncbi:hypothetical protein ACXN5S_17900 [Pseudoroseicyclus sp. H15]
MKAFWKPAGESGDSAQANHRRAELWSDCELVRSMPVPVQKGIGMVI